jgi:hypothetical protein
MNLYDQLSILIPDLGILKSQPILDKYNYHVGYQSFLYDLNSYPISGGTHEDKDISIRIAIAEAFERSLFLKISQDVELSKRFMIEEFPSTSGFAAGFDKQSTRFRAICEGVERWCWSKWIDEKFILEKIMTPINFSTLSKSLIDQFDSYDLYSKNLKISISETENLNLKFVVFLGYKNNGVFPGSRVSTEFDDLYEHSVIEASRNLNNQKFLQIDSESSDLDIIEKRMFYFSQNKTVALNIINESKNFDWPKPEIEMLEGYDTQIENVYLFRALLKDFVGWHLGDEKRFVY